MALPAIRDVRRHFSGASLTVAARPSVAPLFRAVPGIDRMTISNRGKATSQLTADIGILLPNSFRSAWLLKRCGRERAVGIPSPIFAASAPDEAVRRPRQKVHFRRVLLQSRSTSSASKPDR